MLSMYLSLLDTDEEKSKLELLYIQYKKFIHYVAYEYMNDKSLTEDAVHNTFLKLIKYLNRIKDIEAPETLTFIGIVTKSVCIDMLRKENSVQNKEIVELETNDNYFESKSVEEVLKMVSMLPDIYRDTAMLKYFYEMDDRQICDIMNISKAALSQRLSRARKLLTEAKL